MVVAQNTGFNLLFEKPGDIQKDLSDRQGELAQGQFTRNKKLEKLPSLEAAKWGIGLMLR